MDLKPSQEAFAMGSSSLRGTEVDGDVSLDANGNVLVDMRLRRLFDYYLSLIGERNPLQIRQLLKDHVAGRYSAQQVEAVLAYFDRYADYLERVAESKLAGMADPAQRLAKAKALRKQALGDEMASAFFAEEEALAALTLKRIAIAADAKLNAEQKAALLAELDRSEGFSARAEADAATLVAEQNRRFDRQNISGQQRSSEREALWGKEAAERLALLDQEHAQWDTRVEQYLYARSRIDADRTLTDAARTQAIDVLRAQHFDAAEQRRVASLEAIGQLKPGG